MGTGETLLLLFFFFSVCVDRQQQQRQTHTHTLVCAETHSAPPVWVGGVATQQLSGAAYGVSNWVEQHSWRTLVQDLASGNQSHNPQLSSPHPTCWCASPRWVRAVGCFLASHQGNQTETCSPRGFYNMFE